MHPLCCLYMATPTLLQHIIIIHNKFEQNPLKVNHIKLLPLYYIGSASKEGAVAAALQPLAYVRNRAIYKVSVRWQKRGITDICTQRTRSSTPKVYAIQYYNIGTFALFFHQIIYNVKFPISFLMMTPFATSTPRDHPLPRVRSQGR